MNVVSVRPAAAPDQAAILALAERQAAFGPLNRTTEEITVRERRALAEAHRQSARPRIAARSAHQQGVQVVTRNSHELAIHRQPARRL
jgi:hypothetical protein